jgi:hypothetical protein
MAQAKVYVAEFNRAYGDNIRTAASRLERQGLNVDKVPHKTTLRIASTACALSRSRSECSSAIAIVSLELAF